MGLSSRTAVILLFLLLFWPQKVLAAGGFRPELSWQRSLESEGSVVHETAIGSMVVEALGLPLSLDQVVFDGGLETPEVNKSHVPVGNLWASWKQYSAPGPNQCGPIYDLRHFRATFNLISKPVAGKVILRSPHYAGNVIPINDNLYVYLNGNFVARLGTSYGARNFGFGGTAAVANETDGWVADGDLGTAAYGFLKTGQNVLDLVAGEWCVWGGLGRLELVMETDEPVVEPFLELPWNFQAGGKNFEDQALNPVSWFDHEYPLQNVPCCTDLVRDYTGDLVKEPYRSHSGYDYGLKNGVLLGTPVLAAAEGSARFTPWQKSGGAGNMIKVDHGNGYETWYEHLASDGLVVAEEGKTVAVTKGQVVGKVGMTGNTTGPHIHFSVFKTEAGYPFGLVDPLGWEGENPDPWELYEVGGKHGAKSSNLFTARVPTRTVSVGPQGGEMDFGKVKVQAKTGPTNFKFSWGPFEKAAEDVGSVLNSFFLTADQLLGGSLTFILDYSTADLLNIDEDSLALYTYDSLEDVWLPMPSVLDKGSKKVTATTDHLSQFALMGKIKDLTAPETVASVSGTKGNPGWYRSNVEIALMAKDNEGGVGLLETVVGVNDLDWTSYSSPVRVASEGAHSVNYLSRDRADNREERKTLEFNIDNLAPEVRIYFKQSQNKIVVEGMDSNLGTISEKNGEYLISDLAGNVLSLKTKLVNQRTQSYIQLLDWLNSQYYIARGTGATTQFFQLNGTKIVTVLYDAKRNQSVISQISGGKVVKETKPGLVLLQIYTEKGNLKWKIS